MNKFKKVISSIGIFIVSMISKVYATGHLGEEIVSMYAVDPGPKQTIRSVVLKIGRIALPAILLFIGLFVVLSKKITKKIKVIVVSVLVIFAIISVILINYILTNI